MILLSYFSKALIPTAYAALSDIGEGFGGMAGGIGEMWGQIKEVFSWTGTTELGMTAPVFLISIIGTFVVKVIGGLSVLVFIYGGVRMISSAADENGVTEGKQAIKYGALGLILALVADAAVSWVIGVVTSMAGG